MVKVVSITNGALVFDDHSRLLSDHDQDCCEHHYLDFSQLSLADFDGLEFDQSSPDFFERVPDYGIRLLPANGHPIGVPGYGYNNGFYSANLLLRLERPGATTDFDITECQEISD